MNTPTQEAGLKLSPEKEAIVRDIAEQLAASIAGLGFPVGMGAAPPEEMCLRAARGIHALYGRTLAAPSPEPMQADLRETIARLAWPQAFAAKDQHSSAAKRAVSEAYERADDILAAMQAKSEPVAWRSMADAPKDRTPIRALIHADLYPRVKQNRDDLERWNGQEIVIHHPGLASDGFDTGWSLSAPVGHGGFPDEWFVGWLPTGAHPSPSAPNPDLAGLVERLSARAEKWSLNGPSARVNIRLGDLREIIRHLASLK